MKEKTSIILLDLVEKANKLKKYGLEKHIAKIGFGFHGQKNNDGSWVFEFDIPDDKELDASLFTLRLFTQHNETFSFNRIEKIVNDDDELSPGFRTNLSIICNQYFNFLQSFPIGIEPNFFEPRVHPSNSDIFSVVLNGEMGHINDSNKRKKFRTWARDGIRLNVLLQAFTRIVLKILLYIYQMADLCEQELSTLPD